MAKVSKNISSRIQELSRKDHEKLVLKAASRDKGFHDFMLVNYIDPEFGEQDLFEEAKADLQLLFVKSYKGYSQEKRVANMLTACSKRIVAFSKVCKHKNLEADLIMFVLEIPFSMSKQSFKTPFTGFIFKVVSLVKRFLKLFESKLHEDYKIDYEDRVNEWLSILHQNCSWLEYVKQLPKQF